MLIKYQWGCTAFILMVNCTSKITSTAHDVFNPFTSGLLSTEVVSRWLSIHLSMLLLTNSIINLALVFWGSPMNRRARLPSKKLWHLLHSGLCPLMVWHGKAGLLCRGRWCRLRGWRISRLFRHSFSHFLVVIMSLFWSRSTRNKSDFAFSFLKTFTFLIIYH